jgi:hypothetical protein
VFAPQVSGPAGQARPDALELISQLCLFQSSLTFPDSLYILAIQSACGLMFA